MFLRAEEFPPRENGFGTGYVYATMRTLDHVLRSALRRWRFGPIEVALVISEQQIDDKAEAEKKQKLAQGFS